MAAVSPVAAVFGVGSMPRAIARSWHATRPLQGRCAPSDAGPCGPGSAPAPPACLDVAMPESIDQIPIHELLIFDGDELILDGSDPSTYIVLDPGMSAEQITAALGWDEAPEDDTDDQESGEPDAS